MAHLPQDQVLFVDESTSIKDIHSHVTRQQHRRKRLSHRKPLSVSSSTSSILQSIRHQRESNNRQVSRPDAPLSLPIPFQYLASKLGPSLSLPTLLREAEDFLNTLSDAFKSSLSPFPETEIGTSKMEGNFMWGAHYLTQNEYRIGGPLLISSFQDLKNELRYDTTHFLLAVLHVMKGCSTKQQWHPFHLLSKYFYQLSVIIFGSYHSITDFSRILYYHANNRALFNSCGLLIDKVWIILYHKSIEAYGTDKNMLAATVSFRALTFVAASLAPDMDDFHHWNNRYLKGTQHKAENKYYLTSRFLHCGVLYKAGRLQESIAMLEEFYPLLSQMGKTMPIETKVIRGCIRLGEYLMEYYEQESAKDNLAQARLVRAREVLEAAMEKSLEHFGPKHIETINAVTVLASLNRKHGLSSVAEAGIEFVVRQ
jgi:hypothetical protein